MAPLAGGPVGVQGLGVAGLDVDPLDNRQTLVDFVISVMFLLVSVVVGSIMALVNSSNLKLKAGTWSLLESAMSIFIAVLLAEGGQDVMYLIFLPHETGFGWIEFLFACFCSVLQQWATWKIVNLEGRSACGLPKKLLYTRAFAGMTCKLAASSWTTFWAFQQVIEREDGTRAPRLLIPLLAAAQMCVFMDIFRRVRAKYVYRDGHLDEVEQEWMTLAAENEMDTAGLVISFLLSQRMRYVIGGRMPDATGVEAAETRDSLEHSWLMIFALCCSALLYKSLGFLVETWVLPWASGLRPAVCRDVALQYMKLLANVCTKETGWLILFTITWTIARLRVVSVRTYEGSLDLVSLDCVLTRSVCSLCCSYLGIAVLLALGHAPIQYTQAWSQGTLQALNITIGFSWRRCFGMCISNVSRYVGPLIIPSQWAGYLAFELAVSLLLGSVLLPVLLNIVTPRAMQTCDEVTRKEGGRRSTFRFSMESLESREERRSSFSLDDSREQRRRSSEIELRAAPS